MPESALHDIIAEHLKLLLLAWKSRSGRSLFIARNLAVRWLEDRPSIGIDPDVCVLEPSPDRPLELSSLRLWKGYPPPTVSFEIVSAGHPHKDYSVLQDRYAAMGTRELVVFDPLLAGPPSLGGPVSLQVWRRDALGIFERVHFGADPAYSRELDAWLHPRGQSLVIAADREGKLLWVTGEEHERAEKERERAEKERERAEKERERAEKEREQHARMALEQRVAELESRIAKP